MVQAHGGLSYPAYQARHITSPRKGRGWKETVDRPIIENDPSTFKDDGIAKRLHIVIPANAGMT